MVSSLRKRLSKRPATSDLQTTSNAADESSAGSSSSHEDINAMLTRSSKVQEPISQSELTSPPPPPAESAKDDQSRMVSPPQSLLDGYKLRTAKVPPAISTVHPATSRRFYQAGKDTAFTENFKDESTQTTLEHLKSPGRTSPHVESQKDTQTCRGVQFEMLRKKDAVGQAPVRESSEEIAALEPRRKRSQSRREQRTDSLGASIKIKDFAAKDSDRTTRSRTASKNDVIPRTPSPLASGHAIDDTGSTPSSTLVCPPSSHERALQSSSNMSPTDPTLRHPPLDATLRPKPLSAGHRRTNSVATIKVMPPRPTADAPPLYVWTSALPSTSRPIGVWLPAKRWTCCMCARRNPGRRAADTIVEQKVCSRLECGHERCVEGCVMSLAIGSIV